MERVRKNWEFWSSVICLAAMAPIMLLLKWPHNLWILLADFAIAVVLLCVWLERQASKPVEPLPVVLVKKKDLEKLIDHVKYVPEIGPALVISEEERKKHGLTPKERT